VTRLKWKLDSDHSKVVLILMQDSERFVPSIPQPQNSFWTHPMELQGDVGQVESRFGPFRDSVGVSTR
jgi:hypothetical protein